MRHLAWLHATPEGAKKSRLKSYIELNEDHPLLKLPEIPQADYLVSLLHEAGLFQSNGMGLSPLSWLEIESWLDALFSTTRTVYMHDGNGVYVPTMTKDLTLSTWEITTIKTMSEAYVSEYNQATDKDRPAPYVHVEEVEIDRKAVASKLLSALRSMKREYGPAKEIEHE